MKELFDKLSSYNIFSCLFPGILFAVITQKYSRYSFIQDDIVMGIFVYYFIGLILSRLGSLIIEPFLRKISFLRFADYKDFVYATKKDVKLEVLLEVNNTYRSLCALFFSLLFLLLYERIELRFSVLKDWSDILIVVFLLLMFLISYRKQTAFIKKRIETNR